MCRWVICRGVEHRGQSISRDRVKGIFEGMKAKTPGEHQICSNFLMGEKEWIGLVHGTVCEPCRGIDCVAASHVPISYRMGLTY